MRKIIYNGTVRWEVGDKERGYGFVKDDGRLALKKCPMPECGLDNYALNVLQGVCTWCGFDANEEKPK